MSGPAAVGSDVFRRYRLTVPLGFGLPTITRVVMARDADEARTEYEARMTRIGAHSVVTLVEEV